MTLLLVSMRAQGCRETLDIVSHTTLGDIRKLLKRPRWCEESPLNISELGSPTLVWDFVKRLLVPPHPQNRTYHYFSRNLWCGKRTGPRQCLNWGCISAPSLWYLLCTLIPPTSSPYTCLWVIGRAGIHPKPAFWPSSLSLSYILSLRMEDFHQVLTRSYSQCQFNM